MSRLLQSIGQTVQDLLRRMTHLVEPRGGEPRGGELPPFEPLRTIAFDAAADAYVIRDNRQTVRDVLHTQKPVALSAPTPVEAAQAYLLAHSGLLGLDAAELRSLKLRPEQEPTDAGVEFRFLSEKTQFDVTTVTFQQTRFALATWQGAISVHLKQLPTQFAIICAQVSRQLLPARDRTKPSDDSIKRLNALDAKTLAERLGIAGVARFERTPVKIWYQRLMIYVYQADKRSPDVLKTLDMPLPPVPPDVADGSQNVVAAVYFDLHRKDLAPTRWVAMVEARTQAVLYVQEFAAGLGGTVHGMVLRADPMTTHGGPPPSAGDDKLNPLRVSTVLPNLKVSSPQALVGRNVQIVNFDRPTQPFPEYDPPTRATGGRFDFDVRTNDFAAVAAYYNCDRFFAFVEEQGLERDHYFPGTTFPLTVDHRGTSTRGGGPEAVTAQCRGMTFVGPGGNEIGGIENVIFCMAESHPDTPIGIACDWRVVLHELGGHGTLQNHVNTSSFLFAHSAGDSFAAILNDPESKAANKGWTFPWVQFDRHHDRKVTNGWFWDGPKDINDTLDQLWREQILSTTHFRAYKSLGGSAAPAQVDKRWFAATYMSYLMLRAIQTLTPPTNPQHASDWLCSLIVADATDWTTKGHSGGAYEKVLYWAFQKQGLFGGHPPVVDVFIDDGRGGQYGYQPKHDHCLAIWNRRAADGRSSNQAPAPGVVNFAYVKIRSGGTQAATSVVVKAFRNTSQTSRNYPSDFAPMQTAQRSAPDMPAQSPAVTVGPFAWIPSAGDNYILMSVAAAGDASNLDKFGPGKSIPDWRLVPNDNNLGMRKL